MQHVCDEIGLPRPSSVVGNTDQQIITLLALSNREGKDLADRVTWTALDTEASFTTVATETQGVVTTIAPGLKFIYNNTMWNRSINRPVPGCLDAQTWQQLKAGNVTGPFPQYRIRGNSILFIPVPTAGQSIYFEYASTTWCTDSLGVNKQTAWNADTDIGRLDENLMELGLHWRFLRSKGLAYAEQFNEYERQVQDAIGRDGGKPYLDMTQSNLRRGLYVPEGSWPV